MTWLRAKDKGSCCSSNTLVPIEDSEEPSDPVDAQAPDPCCDTHECC